MQMLSERNCAAHSSACTVSHTGSACRLLAFQFQAVPGSICRAVLAFRQLVGMRAYIQQLDFNQWHHFQNFPKVDSVSGSDQKLAGACRTRTKPGRKSLVMACQGQKPSQLLRGCTVYACPNRRARLQLKGIHWALSTFRASWRILSSRLSMPGPFHQGTCCL